MSKKHCDNIITQENINFYGYVKIHAMTESKNLQFD